MAIKKTVEIDVEIVKAQGGLDAFTKNIQQADTATKSLKAQLREAQNEVSELSNKFGATSREAVEAAKKTAELKDRIGDAKSLTDAFNPDAKFKALSASLGGVAGGFAAYQGALGLVGVESKQLEEQLLKVQSAMAISQGLQSIGESVDSFKQLGAVIKSLSVIQVANNFIQTGSISLKREDAIATVAQSTATVAATAATGAATTGMKLLRLAIIGTGVGALIVGLVALYQNFDKVKQTVLNFLPGLKNLGDFFSNIYNSITDFVGATSDASRALDKMRESADKSLALNKKYLEQQGDQLDEFTKKKIDAKNKYLEALKDEGNSEKDRVELAKRLNRELAAADKEREDEREKKRKDAADKLIKDAKKNELTETEKKEKLKKLTEDYNKEIDQSQTDFDVSSLEILDATNQAKRDKDNKFKEDQLASEQQFQLQIAQLTFDSADSVAAREEEARLLKIQRFNEQKEVLVGIAMQLADGLEAVESLSNKNSKAAASIKKGIALVDIGISTATAFGSAIKEARAAGAAAQLAAPLIPGIGIVASIASYASSAAMIIGNVAKAKAILGGGGGAPSGGGSASTSGGGGGTPTATPQFNIVGQSSTNQLAQTISSQQKQPIKTYVVAGDVTTQQSLDRNAVQTSTFGG